MWTQLSDVNADYAIAANIAGTAEGDGVVGDFGTTGMWFYSQDLGGWTQRQRRKRRLHGAGGYGLAERGPRGLREHWGVDMQPAVDPGPGSDSPAYGAWTQLSGIDSEYCWLEYVTGFCR